MSARHEQEALFSLDTPSLKGLSYVLRHKELWPKNFMWNYAHCTDCAMGLAVKLWNLKVRNLPDLGSTLPEISNYLGVYEDDAYEFFVRANRMPNGEVICDLYSVTPEMVAKRIDLYLQKDRCQ